MNKNILLASSILCGACLFPLSGAFASGVPTTDAPYVSEGEIAVETKAAYNIDDENGDDSWGGEVTVGYGVTSY